MADISVTLTLEQWNVVGAALDEVPRRISNPIYVAIAQQLAAAQAPKPEAPAETEGT